jgi:hypothetical protein
LVPAGAVKVARVVRAAKAVKVARVARLLVGPVEHLLAAQPLLPHNLRHLHLRSTRT